MGTQRPHRHKIPECPKNLSECIFLGALARTVGPIEVEDLKVSHSLKVRCLLHCWENVGGEAVRIAPSMMNAHYPYPNTNPNP